MRVSKKFLEEKVVKRETSFFTERVGELTKGTLKFPVHCLMVFDKDLPEGMYKTPLDDLLANALRFGFLPFPDMIEDRSISADLDLGVGPPGYWVIAEVESTGGSGECVRLQYIEIDESEEESHEFSEWTIQPTTFSFVFHKNEGLLLVGQPIAVC